MKIRTTQPADQMHHLDYLIRRTKSNPALMMQMISLYLEQTPPLVAAMKLGLMNKTGMACTPLYIR